MIRSRGIDLLRAHVAGATVEALAQQFHMSAAGVTRFLLMVDRVGRAARDRDRALFAQLMLLRDLELAKAIEQEEKR